MFNSLNLPTSSTIFRHLTQCLLFPSVIATPHAPYIINYFSSVLSKFGDLSQLANAEALVDRVCEFVEANPNKWLASNGEPIRFCTSYTVEFNQKAYVHGKTKTTEQKEKLHISWFPAGKVRAHTRAHEAWHKYPLAFIRNPIKTANPAFWSWLWGK